MRILLKQYSSSSRWWHPDMLRRNVNPVTVLALIGGWLLTTTIIAAPGAGMGVLMALATLILGFFAGRMARTQEGSHEGQSLQPVPGAATNAKAPEERHERSLLPVYKRRFLIRQSQKWVPLEVCDIAWFTVDGKVCFVRTRDGRRLVVDYSLEELSEMLDPHDFHRVNRSFVVHYSAIKSVAPYFGGKLLLTVEPAIDGVEIIVSKDKANAVKLWLGK